MEYAFPNLYGIVYMCVNVKHFYKQQKTLSHNVSYYGTNRLF